MEKSRRARYTHEFKLEALRMIGAVQSRFYKIGLRRSK